MTRQPLFPGDKGIKQLNKIIDVLGPPTEEDIADFADPFFKKYVARLEPSEAKPLAELIPEATEDAIDLL